MTVEVDTRSLKQLWTAIADLADHIEDIEDASDEIGDVLTDIAKDVAPVKGGALRSGIGYRVATNRKGRTRITMFSRKVPYAARQHWVQQQGKPGDRYLWNTLAENQDLVVDILTEHANKGIDRFNRSGDP